MKIVSINTNKDQREKEEIKAFADQLVEKWRRKAKSKKSKPIKTRA